MRKTATLGSALLVLLATAAPASARLAATGGFWGVAPQPADGAPGDPALVNFAHVYNFDFPGPPATSKGTDIEFYTSTVPLRDYATGELILDPDGNPIMADRDFAVVGSYDRGAFVFDITDPESTRFVRQILCKQQQNDIQLKKFGDTWVLGLAMDVFPGSGTLCVTLKKGPSGAGGISFFDVTDPYEFKPMYSFRVADGAHNFTFHPTKPFGYVSTGDLPGGVDHIPIIDFTNLASPVQTADPQIEGGPHDIAFSPTGDRAYVAAENNLRIYDTTNPANPVQVSMTPNGGTYSHGLDPTPDGTLMVHTNESLALGGFFANGTALCPGEGLTFYDIEGGLEESPVPVGYYEANIQGRGPDHRACTGHVGEIAPNSHVMVLGWYIGGVRVVDFSNPSLPQELGSAVMQGTEVWSAKLHKGPYVYTGDLGRGFDVFRWTGALPAPWEAP